MKKVIIYLIGIPAIFISIYCLMFAVSGTYSLFTGDISERARGQLGLLLIVDYLIIAFFGAIGYFCYRISKKV